MNWNEFQKQIGKVDFKVKPKVDWKNWKNPAKLINLEKTSFDIKFNQDIKDKDIQLKLEVNGNASILTSGVNEDNFKFQPSLLGECDIKKGGKFKYQISPDIKMNGKLNGGEVHLGFSKDLTNDDVVLSFNIDGKMTKCKSLKGEATLQLSIKT